MDELKKILADIKSRALPMQEIPGFLLWAAKKSHLGIWLAAFVAGVVFWRKRR